MYYNFFHSSVNGPLDCFCDLDFKYCFNEHCMRSMGFKLALVYLFTQIGKGTCKRGPHPGRAQWRPRRHLQSVGCPLDDSASLCFLRDEKVLLHFLVQRYKLNCLMSKQKEKFWKSFGSLECIMNTNMAYISFPARFVPLSNQNRKLVEAIQQGKWIYHLQ